MKNSGFIYLLKEVLETKDCIGLFREPSHDFGYPEFSLVGKYVNTEELTKEGFKYWKIKLMNHQNRPITVLYFHPKGENDLPWPDFFVRNSVYFFKGIVSQRNEGSNYLVVRWAYELPVHSQRLARKLQSIFPAKIVAGILPSCGGTELEYVPPFVQPEKIVENVIPTKDLQERVEKHLAGDFSDIQKKETDWDPPSTAGYDVKFIPAEEIDMEPKEDWNEGESI